MNSNATKLDYLPTLIDKEKAVCRVTDGSDEDAMLLARQEFEREHVLELTTIELDRRAPVEAVKRHAIPDQARPALRL